MLFASRFPREAFARAVATMGNSEDDTAAVQVNANSLRYALFALSNASMAIGQVRSEEQPIFPMRSMRCLTV